MPAGQFQSGSGFLLQSIACFLSEMKKKDGLFRQSARVHRRLPRRQAAQVNFAAGSKPAQFVLFAVSDEESGFGQVVFLCDVLHQPVRQPVFQKTDGSRVSLEYGMSEDIHDILFEYQVIHHPLFFVYPIFPGRAGSGYVGFAV